MKIDMEKKSKGNIERRTMMIIKRLMNNKERRSHV